MAYAGTHHRRRAERLLRRRLPRGGRRSEAAGKITDLLAGQHGYDHVVATKDYHIDPGGHFSENPAGTPGAPWMRGHHSAAYSGFEGVLPDGTALGGWLRERGVDEVDMFGIATDFCVAATAAGAATAGLRTRGPLDLTAGAAPESTAHAIENLRAAGVEIG